MEIKKILLFLKITALFSWRCFGQIEIVLPKNDQSFSNHEDINFHVSSNNLSNYEWQFSSDSVFQNIIFDTLVNTTSFSKKLNSFNHYIYSRVKIQSDTNWSKYLRFSNNDFINNSFLWLRSDSVILNGNKVELWYDLSQNENHASQTNNEYQPELISIDSTINQPCIEFDGINDVLLGGIISEINESSFTMHILHKGKSDDGSIASGIFRINEASNGIGVYRRFYQNSNHPLYIQKNASILPQSFDIFPESGYPFNLLTVDKTINSSTLFFLNDSLLGQSGNSTLNGTFQNSIYKIGDGYQNLHGFISEILILSQPSNFLKQQSKRYLIDRYAPPINLGPDKIVNYGFCDVDLSPSNNNFYNSYLWNTGDTTKSINVNEPGVYWLETVDIFGRSTRDSIELNRPPYDDIQIQNQIVCPNESTLITANLPQGNYTFQQWSDGNTNPIRILNQNESISYSVLDSLGCMRSSNTALVLIDNSLESISLGVDTSLCSGNSIQLIQDTSAISNWLWNTQDTTSNITVDTSGVYILNITNDNGCQNSDTIEVTIIGEAPNLSYSIPFEICQGSELNFTENSTVPPGNTIDEVIWNFGEVDSVFSSSGAQIYQDSGLYTGFLEVSTLEGCSSHDEFTITVHPKPIISFTTENYCPYEEIEFSASNEYDIPLFFYNWEFGQNTSSSTDVYPSYTYGTNGNYDVQLIAVDTNNCIDTVTQNVFVQPAPVAEISIFDPCEFAPLEIIDNSSIDDTFSIVTYSWNYGDNTSAINPSEDKIYDSYGEYNVQLVLEANNGCVDSIEQLISVHPKPVLTYEIGPACKNTWTSLKNISTIPEGSLTETNWFINLQYNFNQQNMAFKFPTLGIQLVNLESISDQGCISDTTFEIDVQDEISANYTVNPMNITSGTPIQFSNESLGADSSFWDFGDGNGFQFNQNQINEITYDQSLNGSSIDVALIITNDIGCRDTSKYTYDIKEAFLDLALQTLFVQDINGYLTVGVELSNLGSVILENMDLYLKSAENGSILENWTGQLGQNESEIYIFNAHPPSYSSTQDDTERFICVEGSVNNSGYLDVDLSNNIICKNIEGSGLVVLPIYPNPTDDDITVSILLTESSPLRVELVDQSGRLILNQDYTENLDSGIHKIVLPFSGLQKGIYHLRVSDSSTTLLEKIVRY